MNSHWDLDQPVRGAWVPVDVLGPTGKQLFLGVLGERPDPQAIDLALSREEEQSADTESDYALQIALAGRLLVAVAEGATQPAWSDLRRAVE
jgi:hypothetical protein